MKSTGYILNGIYYSDKEPAKDGVSGDSATYKSHDHDRQRENHQFEIMQPYKDGKPNPEFIQHYPEEARNYGFIQ